MIHTLDFSQIEPLRESTMHQHLFWHSRFSRSALYLHHLVHSILKSHLFESHDFKAVPAQRTLLPHVPQRKSRFFASAKQIHVPQVRDAIPYFLRSMIWIFVIHMSVRQTCIYYAPWGGSLISHDQRGGFLHDFAQSFGFLLLWGSGSHLKVPLPLEVVVQPFDLSFMTYLLSSFIGSRKSLHVPRIGKLVLLAPIGTLDPIVLPDDKSILIAPLSTWNSIDLSR